MGVVRFENVSLRYDSGTPVLNGVSFDLAPGSFHFLTGPSGAGKTSLLRLIYMAQMPTSGRIQLFGQNATSLSRRGRGALRRRIGVVFQNFRLIDHLSALENVALPLRIAGARESLIRKHVPELLAWVGLSDHLNALPPSLSGGQQQRVAIARSLCMQPKIMLFDEPTSALDPEMIKEVLDLSLIHI